MPFSWFYSKNVFTFGCQASMWLFGYIFVGPRLSFILLAEDNSGVSITPQLHCNLRTFGGYAAFKFSATCEKTWCLFIQHLPFLQGRGLEKQEKCTWDLETAAQEICHEEQPGAAENISEKDLKIQIQTNHPKVGKNLKFKTSSEESALTELA